LNLFCRAFLLIPVILLAGCSNPQPEHEAPLPSTAPASPVASSETSQQDPRPLIVAFGDSLTAGSGVAPEQNYPSKLQRKVDASGYYYRVVNAGVSGDTSSQGLNRLRSIVDLNPSLVIVELGANDGLRGLPVETTRANLEAIVAALNKAGAEVIIAGMEMPPNYGPAYTSDFRKIFTEIAVKYKAPFIPFFLEGVGGHPELNQQDGIHPTEEGYDMVVDNIWRVLEPLLKSPPRGAVAPPLQ
jgi:acyl-CoA thioesterase-1